MNEFDFDVLDEMFKFSAKRKIKTTTLLCNNPITDK